MPKFASGERFGQEHIGRKARSIETGWRGKIIKARRFKEFDDELLLELEDGDDDHRWFAPADLWLLPQ